MNTTTDKITLSVLESFGDVYGAIRFVRESHKPWPDSITKPFLKRDHSVAEAKDYAKALEKYTKDEILYKKAKDEVIKYNNELDNLLETLMKEESGLNKLPEANRAKIWSLAWENGHSSGYSDVYTHLCDYINLFN